MTCFTTWGPVRGCCGHAHINRDAAERCIEKDHAGCRSQGGYSDRHIRAIESREEITNYDVTRGPGKPITE